MSDAPLASSTPRDTRIAPFDDHWDAAGLPGPSPRVAWIR